MDTLIHQAEEAEEVLKDSDAVGSPELSVIQTRMEKLKVQKILLPVLYNQMLSLLTLFGPEMFLLTVSHNVFSGSSVEAE